LAVLIALGGSACTRDNPGFGNGVDEGTDSHASADSTVADDGLESRTTHGEDTSHGDTRGTGDIGDTGDTGDTLPDDTTDTASACMVPAHATFDVAVLNANKQTIDPACGHTETRTGMLDFATMNELVVDACPGPCGACRVDSEPTAFVFDDILPIPLPDLIEPSAPTCVTVSLNHSPLEEGCTLQWVSVLAQVDGGDGATRVFAAANEAAGELTVPPITLGAPQTTCESHDCSGKPPGRYALQAIINGQTTQFLPLQDPIELLLTVADVSGAYKVQALFGLIDTECHEHVGWVAYGGE
jgi:hypothetical protein